MSKSKGNVVDPWSILNKQGADTARWYMYTSAPPGDSRRFSGKLVDEVISGFYLTLWNTYSFFVTYANLDFADVRDMLRETVPLRARDELDRWILGELNTLIRTVTQAYETYDVTGCTRPIETFVDDLSNWWLRRSRRRFWQDSSDAQHTAKRAAYQTLYECLVGVARLLAPAMPFLAEALYRGLVTDLDPTAADSVHLTAWLTPNESVIDQTLLDEMRLIKRLVSLGHAARNSVNLKVRQPLAEASFGVRTAAEAAALRRMAHTVGEELNVKAVHVLDDSATGMMVSYVLNPLPVKLGKRLGKHFPAVQKTLREGDAASVTAWATALLKGQNVTLAVNGASVEVTPDEVEVLRRAAEGFTVAEENGYVAALQTALTEALILEGLAREVVRRVNTMRRDADYGLSDTITVSYTASAKVRQALAQFGTYISDEVQATALTESTAPSGDRVETFDFDGESVTLAVKRAG